MKKVITAITSTVLLLSVLSISVFGAGVSTTAQDVKKEFQATASYVMENLLKNTEPGKMNTNAKVVAAIVKSGIACEPLKTAYQTDLKTLLDSSDGKMLDYSGAESASYYALAIEALEAMELDAAKFQGYDLFAALNGVTAVEENPYSNAYTLITMNNYKDKITNSVLETNLIDFLIGKFMETETGIGWDYWGVNADNNGQIISGLAPYYQTNETVKSQIDKAMVWNETQKNDEGYLGYSATPSADTTALILEADCRMQLKGKAEVTYQMLYGFRSDSVPGAYTLDGEVNAFATNSALYGLSAYYAFVAGNETDETTTELTTEPITQEPTTQAPVPTTQPTTVTTQPATHNGSKDVPKTGDQSSLVWFPAAVALLSALAVVGMKKRPVTEK